MERIYRLTCGPYYEKQELGYLTEDKLNDYLEELFNSALIQSSIRSHIETLKVQKMAYETQRHHIVQDMNKCLPILQDGKTNPKYKETKKEYRKYERAVIDCKWQMKKIDKLIEECNKWTATDWLHWADYNWEPIELNIVRPVNEMVSEDWM